MRAFFGPSVCLIADYFRGAAQTAEQLRIVAIPHRIATPDVSTSHVSRSLESCDEQAQVERFRNHDAGIGCTDMFRVSARLRRNHRQAVDDRLQDHGSRGLKPSRMDEQISGRHQLRYVVANPKSLDAVRDPGPPGPPAQAACSARSAWADARNDQEGIRT